MRAFTIASLLIITVLAGCAEQPPEPAAQAEPAPVTAAAQLNVTTAGGLGDEPASPNDFLFAVTPEAPVQAYKIRVPTGRSYDICDGCNFERMDLIFAPIVKEAPESMAVFFFDLDTGDIVYGRAMTPVQGTSYLSLLTADFDERADLSSWVSAWSTDVAGTDLGVVVAANGITEPTGLALHFAAKDVSPFDLPSGTDILEDAPTTPEVVGTGTGFTVEAYAEVFLGLLGTPGLFGVESRIGEPEVQEALPTFVKPHGGARDARFVSAPATESGWSYAATTYLAAEGYTEWIHNVAAGSQAFDDHGYLAYGNGYGLMASALVWGLPIGVATGDGSGIPEASLGVTSATTNEFYVLLTQTLGLNESVEALLGVPSPGYAFGFEGLLSLDQDQGLIRTEAGHSVIEMPLI